MHSVQSVFRIRDGAVATKDRDLFVSTQVDEIATASTAGYLSISRMETEVCAVYPKDETALTKIVLVKETYFTNRQKTHHGFVLYSVVNTTQGWKIYKAVPDI